jgi:serine/threonine-protein kinase
MVLANRYRIAGLLGKGGMGEVYRAYDLTLEQPVALKFLPEASAANPAAMARLRNEVRIARQVSQPNVCRVYDIGQVQGQFYISMEYVDGEDLSSLLRRIGRLPADKGVEIAWRLCAGLAAAHAKGVLHRDLKPSNVMVDGRGQVFITDFGLACLTEQLPGIEVRQGTPCYMAPEQLSGKEVSVSSDIYSLGLLLYEMFTGKRVFQPNSRAELLRLHENMLLTSPSFLVKDLDPSVERLILSCLDPNPRNRPYSAWAVSSGLPGGDPLAAALAAGETPSPDMVAAAAATAGLTSRVAAWCMASVVIGLASVALLSTQVNLIERGLLSARPMPWCKRRAISSKASDTVTTPTDSAHGFRYDANSYLRYVEKHDPSPNRWSRLAAHQPPLIHFWYCQSPVYLEPGSHFGRSVGPSRIMSVAATVDACDSPAVAPGLVRVKLDPLGRLLYLSAAPSQAEEAPDRSVLFDLELSRGASQVGFTRAATMDSTRRVRCPSRLGGIYGTTGLFAAR